jgi:plastocyanin
MKKSWIAVLVLVLTGCGHWFHTSDNTPAMSDQATIININGNQFSPGTVTVPAGRTVYWKNSDGRTHRIVLDNRQYDSSDIYAGSIGCGLVLSEAGTYAYHDLNNPSMPGTIVVTH